MGETWGQGEEAVAERLPWKPTREGGQPGQVPRARKRVLAAQLWVSCLRFMLSLTKGKQKGESEKEFLI